MRKNFGWRSTVGLTAFVALAATALIVFVGGAGASGNAGYTTFIDASKCLGGSGVNCNVYVAKTDVWINGGPSTGAGLTNGSYFFAVLVPGYQNGGFVDGADGNLSDTTASHDSKSDSTFLGAGGGDAVTNRTFTVSGGKVTASGGSHAQCDSNLATLTCPTASNQGLLIQLSPYDDTTNKGGVYILAICKAGTTSPSDCKYDAFKVKPADCVGDCTPTDFGVISGQKYYDVNHNGQLDGGELGIVNWPMTYDDGTTHNFTTGAGGIFTISNLPFGTYTFAEVQSAVTAWTQTGNTVDQSNTTSPSTVTLLSDKTYVVDLETSTVSGLNFGNVCTTTNTGGLTLGFWSNQNGRAILQANDDAWRLLLNGYNLYKPTPAGNFDLLLLPNVFATFNNKGALTGGQYNVFRNWLLGADASITSNMGYMLSAQMAATILDITYPASKLDGTAFVPDPGNPTGPWITINAAIAAANSLLGQLISGTTVSRSTLEAYKNLFDSLNNNRASVTPATPSGCPAAFPTP